MTDVKRAGARNADPLPNEQSAGSNLNSEITAAAQAHGLLFRERRLLPVMAIDIGERQNPPTEERINELAQDMGREGQRYPILVRPVARGTYKVVCGNSPGSRSPLKLA
jgi:hypothetical protein